MHGGTRTLSGQLALGWPLGIGTMVAAVAIVFVGVSYAEDLPKGNAWVEQYVAHTDTGTRLITLGDGQFFGMIAEDPTLARPQQLLVDDDNGAFAYRAMRPAFGWGTWLFSLGQPSLVPPALLLLSLLSVPLLVLGVHDLAIALGNDPRIAAAVVILPGVVRILTWTGPEIAAAACGCLGAAAAVGGRPRRAAVWLTGAVLLRETLLLVALGLVLARALRLRWALLPTLVLGTWIALVWLRVGALPGGGDRFQIAGLVEASRAWNGIAWLSVALLAVLMVLSTLRGRLGLALVVPHAVLLATMAPITGGLSDLTRIMLPMYALGLALSSPPCSDTGTPLLA